MVRSAIDRLNSADARIAIVGGGKMGEAILAGWLGASDGIAGEWNASNFVVVNPGKARRSYLEDAHGIACVGDSSLLDNADLVVFSVKPQVAFDVLPALRALPFMSDALFVSIAAGITTSALELRLPSSCHVVRAMPNTPLLVGKGATTLCAGSATSDEEMALVVQLFSLIGEAHQVEEGLMDVTCAINGSGPAYFAAMIEAMADAAAQAGLDRNLAERLATQTAFGTTSLMVERRQTAEKTRLDVCSPGGTTLAALDAMNRAGFAQAVAAGVKAAIERGKELGA